ncbi:DUF1273 domain-containing protein [Ligilactobacillus sp. WILCCON 0076]|uniref:DUF1273 domain-containing protein n=1 Tax=Ligilactobacillus ubinensis TaxID=2876789 RepID=A0A9X2FRH4_9LACO|nr:DUF1273 domain-containing protein [Ligilactobacillus ubinensis]MCP0887703.1 DUF1273 domain-containing protein [Ligilactobacillus ubinensis]
MRLWVSGYRSYELGIFNSKDERILVIKAAIKQELIQKFDQGLEWIITGPQLGVEQWTIETALEIKNEYPELKIALIEPYTEFSKNWAEDKQHKLTALQTQVDFFASVSKKKYNNPQQLHNCTKFMIAHTDEAMFVYDPEFEGKIKYNYQAVKEEQEKRDYALELIDMYELQEKALQINEEKSNK